MSFGQCQKCKEYLTLAEYNATQSIILCAIEAPRNLCFKCISQIIKSQPDLLKACEKDLKLLEQLHNSSRRPQPIEMANAIINSEAAISKAKEGGE